MDVKIFVGNVAESSDNAELSALFEEFGEVTECDIVGNFAFVHMSDLKHANNAIDALNQKKFNGNNLRLELSTKRTQGRKREREQNDELEYGGGGGRGGRGMRGGGRGGGRGARFDPYGEEPPARRRSGGGADPLAMADLAYERDLYKDAYYDLYKEVLARDPMLLREIRSGRPAAPPPQHDGGPGDFYPRRQGAMPPPPDPMQSGSGSVSQKPSWWSDDMA